MTLDATQTYEPLANAQTSLSSEERDVVLHCIDVVESRSKDLKQKGLNSWRFFFGVTNLVMVTWVFGEHPEHFWILYIVETLVLFPLRWMHMYAAQPLNEVFYWFDFCWIANFVGNVMIMLLLVRAYFAATPLQALNGDPVREALFCTFWGIACGPLLCAVGALGNALIFHDADNTASVFIHLFPSLLLYTFRWQSERVVEAWPTLFHLNYFDRVSPWSDIYLRACAAYLVWWLLYSLWLILCGSKLPSKGYDTVYHFLMRSPNPVSKILGWSDEELARRSKANDFGIPSMLIYMLLHAVAVTTAITVSIACFSNQYFHGSACALMLLSSIYKGSSRYSYYMVDQYTIMLRREFKDVLMDKGIPGIEPPV